MHGQYGECVLTCMQFSLPISSKFCLITLKPSDSSDSPQIINMNLTQLRKSFCEILLHFETSDVLVLVWDV